MFGPETYHQNVAMIFQWFDVHSNGSIPSSYYLIIIIIIIMVYGDVFLWLDASRKLLPSQFSNVFNNSFALWTAKTNNGTKNQVIRCEIDRYLCGTLFIYSTFLPFSIQMKWLEWFLHPSQTESKFSIQNSNPFCFQKDLGLSLLFFFFLPEMNRTKVRCICNCN